ncbi:MAG TPA: hypothetical protein VMK82_00200, partial [Steroidobacteraceae bacterium]|nr:hypothetical protein [Steroidobacteraceae bacterium]
GPPALHFNGTPSVGADAPDVLGTPDQQRSIPHLIQVQAGFDFQSECRRSMAPYRARDPALDLLSTGLGIAQRRPTHNMYR